MLALGLGTRFAGTSIPSSFNARVTTADFPTAVDLFSAGKSRRLLFGS
jgi:hypothetical protein